QLEQATAQAGAAVQDVAQAINNIADGASTNSRSAEDTRSAVTQLVVSIDGIASGSAEQAQQVRVADSITTELVSGVERVAATAQHVATASEEARVAAERGAASVLATT